MTELNIAVCEQEIGEGRRCPSCLEGWHVYPDGSASLVHDDDCEFLKQSPTEQALVATPQ